MFKEIVKSNNKDCAKLKKKRKQKKNKRIMEKSQSMLSELKRKLKIYAKYSWS